MCKVAVAVFLVICVIAATLSKNDRVRWLPSADQNRCAAVLSRRLANVSNAFSTNALLRSLGCLSPLSPRLRTGRPQDPSLERAVCGSREPFFRQLCLIHYPRAEADSETTVPAGTAAGRV